MADAHTKNHDYHIVDPSPWPIIGGSGALIMGNWRYCLYAISK